MRTGLTISAAGHAAVLLWSVLTLVVRPYHADTSQALPIDVISTTEFSQITNGAKNAPQAEKPKPVADKVAEAAPADDPTAKLAQKEVKAATDVPPVPKPLEPKVKKPPQPPAPTDPIAEALKKDEDKKPEPKKPDPKPPTPPKKPAQQEAPQFDPRKVEALLDKRTPQRVASAGNEINNTPALGLPNGAAGQLSQTELMALRAKLQELWSPPAGARDPQELTLDVEIQLKPDGTLAAAPIVLTGGNSPLFLAAKNSAERAVYRGQPYTMLRPEHYELWKDIIVTFDPRFMMSN
jgi:outer membrane biosynthesis protein TonB